MTKTHTQTTLDQWTRLVEILTAVDPTITLDGQNLSVSEVTAVSRYDIVASVDSSVYKKIQASSDALHGRLSDGKIIYGVNTGFGGTADVRNNQATELQKVLVRELHYGIMNISSRDLEPTSQLGKAMPLSQVEHTHLDVLPKQWTRAAILIRINSLIKGASSVRPIVVNRLLDLLRLDIIPVIPLHGSISASGDLSPLSYIAGAIQGKPTIRVHGPTERFADEVFSSHEIAPLMLEAKEGLAITNGTAISAASASLALDDAHHLAQLSQVLTAMTCEALLGSTESYDPYFSVMRPHPGQMEVAENIRKFLRGSQLARINDGTGSGLRQDRYSIRSAPQWLGPVLEDMLLAHQQITIELNSTTDNPLEHDGRFLHGANFQAKTVTSAMEKVRQGTCSIGRMLYTQCTEMINPATSRGLPPNLVIDDPGTSFIFKGTDINMAALQSELGFLSNPVNHVQSAEMGNQALNSLALISARYTHKSNEILFQMVAAHLVAACQALDIRALYESYFVAVKPRIARILEEELESVTGFDTSQARFILESMMVTFRTTWDLIVSMDMSDRIHKLAKAMFENLLTHVSPIHWPILIGVKARIAGELSDSWFPHKDSYLAHGNAMHFVGLASGKVYEFIRKDLGVPFLHTEVIRTPHKEHGTDIRKAATVGSYTSLVYRNLRLGKAKSIVADCLGETEAE